MSNAFTPFRWFFFLSLPLVSFIACGGGGGGEDVATEESAALTAGDIAIGFGGAADLSGDVFEFRAIAQFFDAQTPRSAPHLCHRYLSWDVAFDETSGGEAENFDHWILATAPKGAKGAPGPNPCQQLLVSFKGTNSQKADDAGLAVGAEPTGIADDFDLKDSDKNKCQRCFGTAFHAFLDRWYGGLTKAGIAVAFTAWNEPNNPAIPGAADADKRLSPEKAAEYYLMAKHICGGHPYTCDVAAGDMASGTAKKGYGLTGDFETHCDADIDAVSCKGASWLDDYKAAIAAHGNDAQFGLGADFRPALWAYHAWGEIEEKVYNGVADPCATDKDTCATRLLVESLKGKWAPKNLVIWDTEVGVGLVKSDTKLSDEVQAEGAAYLLKISAAYNIERIYYQGVETAQWKIQCDTANGEPGPIRPSYTVLASRNPRFDGGASTAVDGGVCSAPGIRQELAAATPCEPGEHHLEGGTLVVCVSDTSIVGSGGGSLLP